jgi:hypothetical protein
MLGDGLPPTPDIFGGRQEMYDPGGQPIIVEQETRGSRWSATAFAAASLRSLDDEGRFERHWPEHVVEVGRGRHHRRVDLRELLLGAATLDADGVAQVLVARRHGGIDPEEAAKVNLTIGLDLEIFERDPTHRALRRVSHDHAGVERR